MQRKGIGEREPKNALILSLYILIRCPRIKYGDADKQVVSEVEVPKGSSEDYICISAENDVSGNKER